jgi:hypothetical protein
MLLKIFSICNAGQRENIQNWNPKEYGNTNYLKQKVDTSAKSVHLQSKHLVTSKPPQFNDTMNDVNKVESSIISSTLMTTGITAVPTVLSRSLRSRDALFASGARNIRPCDKSTPAMVQLEPCSKDQVESGDGCQSLQYQAQSSMFIYL